MPIEEGEVSPGLRHFVFYVKSRFASLLPSHGE